MPGGGEEKVLTLLKGFSLRDGRTERERRGGEKERELGASEWVVAERATRERDGGRQKWL